MYNYKGSNGKQHSLVVHLVWDQGVAGSNPVFPTIYKNWGHSSAGRAPALHAGGQRFDPAWLHQLNSFKNIWRDSSAGQSIRFIPGGSRVRIPLPLPFLFKVPIGHILRTLSSVGQSYRLITDRSQVRVLQGPPLILRRFTQVWLKGLVLKTSRGLTSCGGSNPSISAIY